MKLVTRSRKNKISIALADEHNRTHCRRVALEQWVVTPRDETSCFITSFELESINRVFLLCTIVTFDGRRESELSPFSVLNRRLKSSFSVLI